MSVLILSSIVLARARSALCSRLLHVADRNHGLTCSGKTNNFSSLTVNQHDTKSLVDDALPIKALTSSNYTPLAVAHTTSAAVESRPRPSRASGTRRRAVAGVPCSSFPQVRTRTLPPTRLHAAIQLGRGSPGRTVLSRAAVGLCQGLDEQEKSNVDRDGTRTAENEMCLRGGDIRERIEGVCL